MLPDSIPVVLSKSPSCSQTHTKTMLLLLLPLYYYYYNHFMALTALWILSEIMSSNPSLPLNPLLETLSCSLAPHIHLTILISALRSANHFPFLWARSHCHATYYFAHNCCTISLSLSMISCLQCFDAVGWAAGRASSL